MRNESPLDELRAAISRVERKRSKPGDLKRVLAAASSTIPEPKPDEASGGCAHRGHCEMCGASWPSPEPVQAGGMREAVKSAITRYRNAATWPEVTWITDQLERALSAEP